MTEETLDPDGANDAENTGQREWYDAADAEHADGRGIVAIISKPRTMELAKELVRRGNRLPFDANCRADIGAEGELLSTVHEAGARLSALDLKAGTSKLFTA